MIKKSPTFIPAVMLLVLFSFASVNAATMTGSSSSASFIIVQQGNKSLLVTAIQKLLVQQGYLSAKPTGYFGPLTKAAVLALQKAHNLPQTGLMSIPASQAAALFAAAAFNSSAVGSTGAQVIFVQQALITGGFLKVAAPTGYYGALTKAAVIAFQTAHGLTQTGIVNQATYAAMGGK